MAFLLDVTAPWWKRHHLPDQVERVVTLRIQQEMQVGTIAKVAVRLEAQLRAGRLTHYISDNRAEVL